MAARVVIVTGASRGLGRGLAIALAATGWDVIADARSSADLDAALGSLANVTIAAGDVTDAGHRSELIALAATKGRLDALVNNASQLGPSPQPALADYPLEELRRVYEVNVLAPLALIAAALPLLEASAGRLVNVTSDAGSEAYPGWGGYGSSKAALEHASKVLAVEHPALKVYWVDPGDMRTAMHQAAYPGEDISDRPAPEERVPALLRLLSEELPSGRYAAGDLLEAGAES